MVSDCFIYTSFLAFFVWLDGPLVSPGQRLFLIASNIASRVLFVHLFVTTTRWIVLVHNPDFQASPSLVIPQSFMVCAGVFFFISYLLSESA